MLKLTLGFMKIVQLFLYFMGTIFRAWGHSSGSQVPELEWKKPQVSS